MTKINAILFALSLVFSFFLPSFLQATTSYPVLKIYTSRSFARGVGKSAKEVFEKTCNCKVEYMDGKSPLNVILSLKIMKNKPDILVQIADDFLQNLSQEEKVDLFLPTDINNKNYTLPISWNDTCIVPLSYGVLSFLYDSQKIKLPPHTFEDLKNSDQKIILMDPRTSQPGFGLLLWVKQIYGEKAGIFWTTLKPKILTITKGWSEATSLFLKGEAPIILSYASSPAYHRLMEEKKNIKACLFQEGQYLQISVGAILKSTPHPQLAKDFLKLLLSREIQKKMVYEDWSYPVVDIGEPLPEEFQAVKKIIPPFLPENIKKNKKIWMKEWLNALS